MSKLITVTFTKWAEWNPRSDYKNPYWFAMSNRITEDDEILTLSDREFRAFIHLFCLASQKNKATVSVNFEKAERVTGIKESVFVECVRKLASFGVCECPDEIRTESVGSTTDPVGSPSDPRQNPSLQNRTLQDNTKKEPASPPAAILNLDKRTADFVASVKPEIQSAWIDLYGDKAWVEREITASVVWCLANPTRAPRSDNARFLTNWLKRGWESYRKSQTSNPRPSIIRAPAQPGEVAKIDLCAQSPKDESPRTLTFEDILAMKNRAGNLGARSAGA